MDPDPGHSSQPHLPPTIRKLTAKRQRQANLASARSQIAVDKAAGAVAGGQGGGGQSSGRGGRGAAGPATPGGRGGGQHSRGRGGSWRGGQSGASPASAGGRGAAGPASAGRHGGGQHSGGRGGGWRGGRGRQGDTGHTAMSSPASRTVRWAESHSAGPQPPPCLPSPPPCSPGSRSSASYSARRRQKRQQALQKQLEQGPCQGCFSSDAKDIIEGDILAQLYTHPGLQFPGWGGGTAEAMGPGVGVCVACVKR
ncbi:hypothetical protein B484DRAFT_213690 [Ochromonadaceae sp. CCMP2298]|nr:hypothetical protein B484DRAFT_213690 [Ochromonadaceae sp. CCMP2298]